MFLWCESGAFIVNFEHILHLFLVFLLLTLDKRECQIIDFAIPGDQNTTIKEQEKLTRTST